MESYNICFSCGWLILLSVMSWRFIHVVACVRISFLFKGWLIFRHTYTYTHSHAHKTYCLSTFWLLRIMLLWTWVCKYLLESLLSLLLGIYPEVELLGHVFNFLSNCHAIFHSSCTILHSYQQCPRLLPISTHSHWHLFFSFFDNNNHNVHEVVVHCGFYFPNDWWHWASFRVFIGYLYFFFSYFKCSRVVLKNFQDFCSPKMWFLWTCIFCQHRSIGEQQDHIILDTSTSLIPDRLKVIRV